MDVNYLPKWRVLSRRRARKTLEKWVPDLNSPWVVQAATAQLIVSTCHFQLTGEKGGWLVYLDQDVVDG